MLCCYLTGQRFHIFIFMLFIMCLGILCCNLRFKVGLTLHLHSNEYIYVDRRCFYYNEVNQKVHFLLTLLNAAIDLFAYRLLLYRTAVATELQLLPFEFIFYLEYHDHARKIIRDIWGNFPSYICKKKYI